MRRLLAVLAVLGLSGLVLGGPAAAAPKLYTYLNADNQNAYAAVYTRDAAFLLSGCATADDARALFGAPPETPVEEVSRGRLSALAQVFVADFEPARPPLPCAADAPGIDKAWPMDAPVWVEIADGGVVYRLAPRRDGVYYRVTSGCPKLRDALGMRARAQPPRHREGAPGGGTREVDLACHAPTAPPRRGDDAATPASLETRWSLHVLETLALDAAAPSRMVFVAKYAPSEFDSAAAPAYLPIWKINGREVSPLFDDPTARDAAAAALRALLQISNDAAPSMLTGAARAKATAGVFADLCLQAACQDAPRDHRVPAIGAAASMRAALLGDIPGRARLVWTLAPNRHAVFAECHGENGENADLIAALGLRAQGAQIDRPSPAAPRFACPSRPTLCRATARTERELRTALARGDGCATLIVSLPAALTLRRALALRGTDPQRVVFRPQSGVSRARLIITPGASSLTKPVCGDVLSASGVFILEGAAARFERVDLITSDDPRASTGVQVSNATLDLQGSTVGETQTVPPRVGVSVCAGGEVYMSNAAARGQNTALEARASEIIASDSTFSAERAGASLRDGAEATLTAVTLAAPTALRVNSSHVHARGARFAPPDGARSQTAIRVIGESSTILARWVDLETFRFNCAVAKASNITADQVRFVLPRVDLTSLRAGESCAPFTLIE